MAFPIRIEEDTHAWQEQGNKEVVKGLQQLNHADAKKQASHPPLYVVSTGTKNKDILYRSIPNPPGFYGTVMSL